MKLFNALVLAGERGEKNPLLEKTGAPCKALVPVKGVPMLMRVLDALIQCTPVDKILLLGPEKRFWEEIASKVTYPKLSWTPQAASPSLSVYKGLEILGEEPVFLTTADHALLRPEIVEYFLHRALKAGGDLAVGIARYETLSVSYPEARRTTYRLKEGAFCSTNLYAFLTPLSHRAVIFWREVETQRKNPLKIVRAFGIKPLAKYLAKKLALKEAFAYVSQALGCNTVPVIIPYPEAAIDVDSVEDLALVEKILDKRGEKQP